MLSDAFAARLSTLYIVAKGEMTYDEQFFFCHNVFNAMNKPNLGYSSVGSDTGCQTKGFQIPAWPTFFPTFVKSHCDKRHYSFTNGLIVYVEKQPVAWKVWCVEYWCEKAKKHMSRWAGRKDMTENNLKMVFYPNQSINQFNFYLQTLPYFLTKLFQKYETDCLKCLIIVSSAKMDTNSKTETVFLKCPNFVSFAKMDANSKTVSKLWNWSPKMPWLYA